MFIPTRESLLSRLKEASADESWREFFETYWKLIYNTARKSGLSDAEAQEVVQETMLALTRQIRDFRYDPARCSFKTWLMQLTRWKIVDQVRIRKKIDLVEEVFEKEIEKEVQAVWDTDWQLNNAEEAIRRVQLRAQPKAMQAFSTSVLQGRGPRETAKLLRMSVPAVYVATLKIRRLIKREMGRLEKGDL